MKGFEVEFFDFEKDKIAKFSNDKENALVFDSRFSRFSISQHPGEN